MSPIEWATVVTAVATVVLAIYAGFQLWLLRNQIRETKASRDASVVLYVLGTLDEYRDKRHALYNLPPDHKTWNSEQTKLADQICVKLQQIAFLAECGLVDPKYIMENYAGVFDKAWQKLEGFVQDYREKCGEGRTIEKGAFQRRHLEMFACKCREYMKSFPNLE